MVFISVAFIGLVILAVVGIMIVMLVLNRSWGNMPTRLEVPPPAAPGRGQSGPADDHTIRRLLAEGKNIEAIKRVREHTGMGLKEAKDYVEALAADPFLTPPSPETATTTVPGDVEHAARQLLAEGKKIQAIKLVREHTGMGLKEAKEYVESLAY